jgi:hypothetical protein
VSSPSAPTPPEGCTDPTGVPTLFQLGTCALYPLSNALYILLSSPVFRNPDFKFRALIDSRSTHCFIDSCFAAEYKLPTAQLDTKIPLQLFNGSVNSILYQIINLEILLPSGETQKVAFYITTLDPSCSVVLGPTGSSNIIHWLTGHWAD